MQRVYGGEAGRLGDVCREGLVFSGPDGVARCLAAIGADPAVRVVRVKNRMDLKYDPSWSAGFRCVRTATLVPERLHSCARG